LVYRNFREAKVFWRVARGGSRRMTIKGGFGFNGLL
jgi:hypothetical protein